MRIYRLYNPNQEYRTIQIANTPLLVAIDHNDYSKTIDIHNTQYHWDNLDKELCDCPFLIGAIPVFRKEKIYKIRYIFSSQDISTTELIVDGASYILLITNNVVKGLLDERKSTITRFSDGRIMTVENYVFKKKKEYPDIFRIEELPLFTFVTDRIANELLEQNLSGLAMEECKTTYSLLSIFNR